MTSLCARCFVQVVIKRVVISEGTSCLSGDRFPSEMLRNLGARSSFLGRFPVTGKLVFPERL
jgi:hypothetical protein